MPTPDDTIDDAAFLAGLAQFDGSLKPDTPAAPVVPDRMALLDRAFPLAARNAAAPDPFPAFADIPAFHDPDAEPLAMERAADDDARPRSRSGARRNDAPALAVALVFVMGLAAGASAAAVVFYDRAAQIVAAWTGPHR